MVLGGKVCLFSTIDILGKNQEDTYEYNNRNPFINAKIKLNDTVMKPDILKETEGLSLNGIE